MELLALHLANDEMVEVVHRHVDETDLVHPEQVLYFDTDSIIFSRRPDQPMLPTGDYLGEFTSKLKSTDHIVEFTSAGPKNYGYITKEGKVECKVRGFTLNAQVTNN